jgi:hypothetical protein
MEYWQPFYSTHGNTQDTIGNDYLSLRFINMLIIYLLRRKNFLLEIITLNSNLEKKSFSDNCDRCH